MKASDLLSTSAAILGLLYAAPMLAQQAPADAEEQGAVTLSEIVVTAQRVEEDVQRTPVAVAVVEPDALIQAGVSRPDQLASLVPALVGQEAGGPYQTFFMRGVGNFTVNPYSDPAIARRHLEQLTRAVLIASTPEHDAAATLAVAAGGPLMAE